MTIWILAVFVVTGTFTDTKVKHIPPVEFSDAASCEAAAKVARDMHSIMQSGETKVSVTCLPLLQ